MSPVYKNLPLYKQRDKQIIHYLLNQYTLMTITYFTIIIIAVSATILVVFLFPKSKFSECDCGEKHPTNNEGNSALEVLQKRNKKKH